MGGISQRGNSPFIYRDGAGWPFVVVVVVLLLLLLLPLNNNARNELSFDKRISITRGS